MKKIIFVFIISFGLGFYLGREQMKKQIKDGIKKTVSDVMEKSIGILSKSLELTDKIIDDIAEELDKNDF